AALTGLTGRTVEVLGAGGLPLASGTLLRAGDGLLVRGNNGDTTLVSNYAAVRATGADFPTGSSLSLRVDAARAGQARDGLSYAPAVLGSRAHDLAMLQPGAACRMQF